MPDENHKSPESGLEQSKQIGAAEEQSTERLRRDSEGTISARGPNRNIIVEGQLTFPPLAGLPSTDSIQSAGSKLKTTGSSESNSTLVATVATEALIEPVALEATPGMAADDPPVERGQSFEHKGQRVKYLGTNSAGSVAILESETAPVAEGNADKPSVIKADAAEIAKNFEAIPVGKRFLYVDKKGGVFEAAGRDLKEVKGMSAVRTSELAVAVTPTTEDDFLDMHDERKKARPKWTDTKAEEKVDGQTFRVEADIGGRHRKVIVGGNEVHFKGEVWFTRSGINGPSGTVKSGSDLKLHIITTGNEDLKRTQAALIPALEEATKPGGQLYGKVFEYKTQDPMFGFDKEWAGKQVGNQDLPLGQRVEPGVKGQGSKGFTIYPATDADAKAVSDFCSKVLKEKALALDRKVDTGNVGDRSVDSSTMRVSLERDGLKGITIPSDHIDGTRVGVLEDKLESSIKDYAERKLKERAEGWESFRNIEDLYEGSPKDGKLSKGALRQVLNDARNDPHDCSLQYANDETGKRRLTFSSPETKSTRPGFFYLEEQNAKKEAKYENGRLVEGMTGRPAFYELSQVVGESVGRDLDPAKLLMDDVAARNEINEPSGRPRPDRTTSGESLVPVPETQLDFNNGRRQVAMPATPGDAKPKSLSKEEAEELKRDQEALKKSTDPADKARLAQLEEVLAASEGRHGPEVQRATLQGIRDWTAKNKGKVVGTGIALGAVSVAALGYYALRKKETTIAPTGPAPRSDVAPSK